MAAVSIQDNSNNNNFCNQYSNSCQNCSSFWWKLNDALLISLIVDGCTLLSKTIINMFKCLTVWWRHLVAEPGAYEQLDHDHEECKFLQADRQPFCPRVITWLVTFLVNLCMVVRLVEAQGGRHLFLLGGFVNYCA